MESLPEDIIIMEILSKLSVKSISRFRCVCKGWYDLFKNPKFINMHLHHAIENNKFSVLLCDSHSGYAEVYYTIDFDVTSSSYLIAVLTDLPQQMQVITDSCDGLIGLTNYYFGGDAVLWNPSTREYEKQWSLKRKEPPYILHIGRRYGICYDWKINDYKLFMIVDAVDTCSEIWVCRLGSSSWENIGNIPYNTCHAMIKIDNTLHTYTSVSEKPLNGIIHWIHSRKVIVCFDIVEERTKEIKIPPCYLKDDQFYEYKDMEVGVLGEILYLTVNTEDKIDLWVMEDYGVMDSWTRIFSFSKDKTCYDSLRPLHYLNKNGEILLHGYVWLEGEDVCEDVLVSYDPENGTLVTLDIPGKPKTFCPTTFVGSLVKLNSGKFVFHGVMID